MPRVESGSFIFNNRHTQLQAARVLVFPEENVKFCVNDDVVLGLIDYSHFRGRYRTRLHRSSLRHRKSFGLCQQFSQHAHVGRLHEVMIEFGLARVSIDFVLAVAGHCY